MLYWVKRRRLVNGKNAGWTDWELAEKRGAQWFFMGWDCGEDRHLDDKVVLANLSDPDGEPYGRRAR